MSTRQNKTVAMIGGGVSGALTAYHLVQQQTSARVIVIDPRPGLGLGLAYSTPTLCHLLNVPAGKISALPAQPKHFLLWLRDNHDPGATDQTFAPRAVFGQYIQSLLAATQGIEHRQAAVVDYEKKGPGAILTLGDGSRLRADLVVLATGNFDPAALAGVSKRALETGVYAQNAWDAATYSNLASDAAVPLVGSGLTSVDVLLRLREAGHRGPVTAISRHSMFPKRHAPYTPAERCAILPDTPAACLGYLRALRNAIGPGTAWRAAIDSLRSTTNDLWLALSLKEQHRFRRHLQRRWDVVRHRMAPSIANTIAAELDAGTLLLREGNLQSVDEWQGSAEVSLRKGETVEYFQSGRVINCTGPNMNYRRVDSVLLRSLFAQGVITAGPLGAGLLSTRSGALIDNNGLISETLFNLGPGRLGTLLESIAIPELREQAVELAATLADRVKRIRMEAMPLTAPNLHPKEAETTAAA